jgi:hypothetical protein
MQHAFYDFTFLFELSTRRSRRKRREKKGEERRERKKEGKKQGRIKKRKERRKRGEDKNKRDKNKFKIQNLNFPTSSGFSQEIHPRLPTRPASQPPL